MKKYLFTGLLFIFLSLNSLAQSEKPTVDLLLEKSGTLTELQHLDQLIDVKISEKKASFEDDESYGKFAETMKAGINSEIAEKHFKEFLIINSKEDSLQSIIALYDQPLFKKMRMAELESNDPDNQQEKMEFFQNMQSNPPAQERVLQLMELNQELGSTEMAISMLNNVMKSMVRGANMSQPEEKQITEQELEKKMEALLPADFSQQLTNQLIAISIYTYRDIEDQDLNEYISYWKSPSGKYYMNLLMNAYDYSFSKMGEKVGEGIKDFEKS